MYTGTEAGICFESINDLKVFAVAAFGVFGQGVKWF